MQRSCAEAEGGYTSYDKTINCGSQLPSVTLYVLRLILERYFLEGMVSGKSSTVGANRLDDRCSKQDIGSISAHHLQTDPHLIRTLRNVRWEAKQMEQNH